MAAIGGPRRRARRRATPAGPRPAGDRVGIIDLAGSGCVAAADACARRGLRIAGLTDETRRTIAAVDGNALTLDRPLEFMHFGEVTFGVDERVIAVMAGGSDAVRNAIERSEDDFDLGVTDVRNLDMGRDDVLIAVSASGRTPCVLGAVEVARAKGALSIAVVNNPGSALAAICDVAV